MYFTQQSIKEHESKLPLKQKEHDAQREQYEAVQQQRINAKKEMVSLAQKCNHMMEKENTLFQHLQRSKLEQNSITQNIDTLKSSFECCEAVIKLYNQFTTENNKYIEKINTNFERKWSEFESRWKAWNVNDILTFFKYNTLEMNDADNIEWDKAEKQMKEKDITGQSLSDFNKLTFEFIGFQNIEIINSLLSKIDELQRTYNENEGKVEEIPDEYLCPITKRIMKDPVIAFDGHSYERKAIEDYLRDNNKSPITGENAEYVIVFPNHKLKANIQKYIEENNIGSQLENEGTAEVDKETIYH